MKLIPARCPNCGSNIEVNKDKETTKCEYCETRIIIEDAIAKYKLEVSGNVNINNLPTAQNYLKIGTRSLENGEYTVAHEKLEKALELDADNPEIIIKEAISKVFQNDLDEKALDKILYSIKVAVKDTKTKENDEVVIYCIKQLEGKRKKLVEFYTENIIAKKGFLFSINKIVSYIKFYEKVFRNYVEEDASKIYIIRIILSCIQDYLLGGKYIEDRENGTSRTISDKIPNDTLQYLNEKKAQYEKELEELDDNFREEQEAKRKASLAAIEEANRRSQEKEFLINKTSNKLLLIVDFGISAIFILFALLFIIISLIEINVIALFFFIISAVIFLPYIVLRELPPIKKLNHETRIGIGIVKYFMGIAFIFIGISTFAEFVDPYVNETFISQDGTTEIKISDTNFIISVNNKEETYLYDSEEIDLDYIIVVKDMVIEKTDTEGSSEASSKEIARYKYNNNDDTLCLFEENKCTEVYTIKESQS